jgi:type II secretory pathway pseudopilin PulG
MLNPLRIAMLVFMALVVLLLASAMPVLTVQQKRQRNATFLLVGIAYITLVLLYLRIFE